MVQPAVSSTPASDVNEVGEAGPDVVGPAEGGRRRGRRLLVWTLLVVLGLPAAAVGWSAFSLSRAWNDLDRVAYDRAAFEALPPVDPAAIRLDPVAEDGAATVPAAVGDDGPDPIGAPDPGVDERYTTYLVVGSDEGDQRADVILLVLLPSDGTAPLMVSLPRDLYLPNRCTQGLTRINANYNGCGPDVNGATLLSGAVRDFTGLEVDHFALFTMDGFETIIDAIGGVEICVEHPVREVDRVELPAGCTTADGATALGWVRSRKTQELVDGRWRTMPGVNDLTRNQRQQDLVLAVAAEAASFGSPRELARFATSLGEAFVLDDRLGLAGAADLAWTHRHVRAGDVQRLTIPVRPHVTPAGAQVLIPTATFAEVMATAGG